MRHPPIFFPKNLAERCIFRNFAEYYLTDEVYLSYSVCPVIVRADDYSSKSHHGRALFYNYQCC